MYPTEIGEEPSLVQARMEMRTRGVDIANQSKAIKIGATQNTTTNGLLTTSLSH